MKLISTPILVFYFSLNALSQTYSTCAAAASGTNIANGQCLSNVSFPGSVNMAGICLGGSNPAVYISFVAGTCPQFTLSPDFNLGPTSPSFGYSIMSAGCATQWTECVGNLVNGQEFTISGINFNGGTQLTPGVEYVLRLYGAVGSNTIDICYDANAPEEPSNECAGAVGLGTTTTTYFNGGDCSFNGTYDDTPSNPSGDGAASLYCAGSLENTQWVEFSPVAGSTNIQIIGTNVNCTSGACAYQFGVFSGACGSLVNEGCVSNGNPCASGPDPNSALTTSGGNVLTWSGVSATGFTATISPPSGTFAGTETFYFAMDGNADAQCYYTLQGINVQPLPVEMVSFHGKYVGGSNKITWEVASQTNNAYFTVQRSIDGTSWQEVQRVNGAGTSSQLIKYFILDDKFDAGINYYRIVQTDFDGAYDYSNVIFVKNLDLNRFVVRVVNTMGQAVDSDYHGIVFDVYSDGTSEKRLQ
jgi:hypothetical protein